jgi:hypothetical protein
MDWHEMCEHFRTNISVLITDWFNANVRSVSIFPAVIHSAHQQGFHGDIHKKDSVKAR